MTTSEFLSIEWGGIEGPLIEPPRLSPVVADPSFLFPEETPGGDWELFAHSAWGIHRYTSPDGARWTERGIAVHNAMRAFVRPLDGERLCPDEGPPAGSGLRGAVPTAAGPEGKRTEPRFGLYYEAYPPLALPLTALPFRRRWRSRIALSTSSDLERWPPGRTLVSPLLPWMRDRSLGFAVSNPCLVRDWTDTYRLYFSASLAWIEDCGFCEPRYIGLARGASPEGPFTPETEPVIDPARDPTPGVLGAGAIKVLPLSDGYIGLQNKIYRDSGGRSRSALFVLRSEDGISWEPARPEPLIAPDAGWTASHVYACDCRFRESEGRWYLYFNARDGWRISEGRERIGRIVGTAV